MKAFAETGRSDVLEEQSQGEGGIYDEFNAPPITTGVGRTEAEFFVDGNHSRVNFKVAFLSDSSPPKKIEWEHVVTRDVCTALKNICFV